MFDEEGYDALMFLVKICSEQIAKIPALFMTFDLHKLIISTNRIDQSRVEVD